MDWAISWEEKPWKGAGDELRTRECAGDELRTRGCELVLTEEVEVEGSLERRVIACGLAFRCRGFCLLSLFLTCLTSLGYLTSNGVFRGLLVETTLLGVRLGFTRTEESETERPGAGAKIFSINF